MNSSQRHVMLLQAVAETWDTCQQAHEALAREGRIVPSARGSGRLNPWCRIEAESRKAFARLLQQLDLAETAAAVRPLGRLA